MQLNIKQLILEGYSYDEITEAVHANHKHLDKSRLKDPKTSYEKREEIKQNRSDLAKSIRNDRSIRDATRKYEISSPENSMQRENRRASANFIDNWARTTSQVGKEEGGTAEEMLNIRPDKRYLVRATIPRIISSAKQ